MTNKEFFNINWYATEKAILGSFLNWPTINENKYYDLLFDIGSSSQDSFEDIYFVKIA